MLLSTLIKAVIKPLSAYNHQMKWKNISHSLYGFEAVWRILWFEGHDRNPTIVHLAIYLENGQRIYFTENNIQEVVNNPRDTTLTAFFKLCAQDDFAKTLRHDRVLSYYTWNQSSKTFQRRKQGTAIDGFPGVKKRMLLAESTWFIPTTANAFIWECYCIL